MLYRFDNIEKSYGPHDVLRGVTWQLWQPRRSAGSPDAGTVGSGARVVARGVSA